MHRLAVLPTLLVLLALAAAPARAEPGLLLGVGDDALKWAQHPAPLRTAVADLGLGAVRFTQTWRPGETRLSSADVHNLDRAVANAQGLRIVLSVYGRADQAPQDAQARSQYCSYVRSIVARYPQIRDVAIWNEVNSSMFWRPQYAPDGTSAAPAAYGALLAACYGPLHAARPGMNVIASLAPRGNDDPRAPGTITHAAATFVRRLGDAYRASGRLVKIFDTFGQNAYPRNSAERPWREHEAAADVSQGDYPRLIAALHDAFGGTGQPLPGEGGVSVWYLENGFQTRIDPARAGAYRGRENDPTALLPVAGGDVAAPAAESPAPDQATQLADSLRLAYCQPGVGAYFNFMLADEVDLAGWQSGLLWADWTRKPSFDAFAAVVREVRAGEVDCATLKGGAAGGADQGLRATAATVAAQPCASGSPLVVAGGSWSRASELLRAAPPASAVEPVVARAAAAARCSSPAVAVDARGTPGTGRAAVVELADAVAAAGAQPFLVVGSAAAARALPDALRVARILVPAKPTAAAVRAARRALGRSGIPAVRAGIVFEAPVRASARKQLTRLAGSLGLGSVWFEGGRR